MAMSYFKLSIAALLPMLATIILYLLDKKTKFGKLNYYAKQVLFGVVFGALAVVGTEWGIPINGAQANARDAAVVTAGLMFGGPAGIIAGLIGGIERWVAVAWGVGTYTRVACTVSTILAGFYSAIIRKIMFENKKPGWFMSLAIGVVMEVFHLTMVFVTHFAEPDKAMAVLVACSIPMIVANGVAVMLSSITVSILSKEGISFKKETAGIAQTIQRWLLIAVAFSFVLTTLFLFQLQTGIAHNQCNAMLSGAVEDVKQDILDASNENLLSITHSVANQLNTNDINDIAEQFGVAEISVIGEDGKIKESTNKNFVGYDMRDGNQSSYFLKLLGDYTELVQDYGPISYDKDTYRKYAGVKINGGFVQVGYDSVNFQKDIDAQVVGITKNRHIGSTGYTIIVNENFRLVSGPVGFKLHKIDANNTNSENLPKDEVFETSVNGEDAFCYFGTAEGYYIVSVMPSQEVYKLRNTAMYANTFIEILIFAVLFIIIYLIIKRVVVNKIMDINDSLSKITGGNLDETINVRSNQEFASLSDDINITVDTLKHYIDEASARIDKELEFAKNIQSSALPNVFPAYPRRKEFDIYARMDTAKEVGGDFYDFYLTGDNYMNILIADVSGKGIPAAMFMMRAKSELKGLTETDYAINDVFTRGNESLCHGNDAGMFVTAWQGRINLETGLVQFANAGHNPPLVKHRDGRFEYLKSRAGFVLAGMEGIKYRLQEIQLEPGDIIYLYTDGVTEATNSSNELYGEDRLLNILNSTEFTDMKALCDTVKADVDKFVGDAEQFDDITMLGFMFNGDNTPFIHFDSARIDDIPAVTDFVNEEMEKLGCGMKTIVQMNVAIDEMYSNIAKFAYKDSDGPVTVKVSETDEPRSVCVTFIDEGMPYNPLTKDDPNVHLSAEEREIGGLGIYMVKKTMDDMQYRYENECNILTLVKRI